MDRRDRRLFATLVILALLILANAYVVLSGLGDGFYAHLRLTLWEDV